MPPTDLFEKDVSRYRDAPQTTRLPDPQLQAPAGPTPAVTGGDVGTPPPTLAEISAPELTAPFMLPQTATRSTPKVDLFSTSIAKYKEPRFVDTEGMSWEDKQTVIQDLAKERNELFFADKHPDMSSAELFAMRRKIDERLRRLTMAGVTDENTWEKLQYDAQGIHTSNVNPLDWGPGFFAASVLRNLAKAGLKGALTRGVTTTLPMTLTETGAELTADIVAPDSPGVAMGISVGLGLSVGNFLDAIADRRMLQLVNYTAPDFFKKNMGGVSDNLDRHVSKQAAKRIRKLATRLDKGDMIALREVQDMLRRQRYKDLEAKMALSKVTDGKVSTLTKKEYDALLNKKSFADISEDDLIKIQEMAEIQSMKGFHERFEKLRDRINEKLALEDFRNDRIQSRITDVSRQGGFDEDRLINMVGKSLVDRLKKKHQYLVVKDGKVDPIKYTVVHSEDFKSVQDMLRKMAGAPTFKQVRSRIDKEMEYDWAVWYMDEFASRVAGSELKMWERIGGKKAIQRIKRSVRGGKPTHTEKTKRLSDIIDETNFIRKAGAEVLEAGSTTGKIDERIRNLTEAVSKQEATAEKLEYTELIGELRVAVRDSDISEEYGDQIHKYLSKYVDDAVDQPDAPSLRNFLDNEVEAGVPLAKLVRKGYEDILELPQMTGKLEDLTLEQLRKIKNLTVDLRKIDKAKSKVETNLITENMDNYIADMGEAADKVFKRPFALTRQRAWLGEKVSRKRKERKARVRGAVTKAASELKRPEFILREYGGWKDFSLPEKMFRSSKWAEDVEFQIAKVTGAEWESVLKSYKAAKKLLGKKGNLNTKFWNQRHQDSMGDLNVDHETMITMALMNGNDHNRKAMSRSLRNKLGVDYSDIAINRFLRENMDDADRALVKDVWKMTDSMYDMMAKVYKKMTGKTLPKVDNYYPIIADKRFNATAENVGMEDIFADMPSMMEVNPQIRRHFMKARVGGSDAIRMDLDALSRHFRDVAHTVSHWEVTSDLSRIIGNKKFAKNMTENLGGDKYRAMRSWVDDLKRAPVTNAPVLKAMRTRTTVAMLGLKFSTAMVQPLSMISAIPRVGKGNLAVATARFMRNPRKTVRMINEMSEQMAGRNKAWQRDISELMSSKYAEKFKTMGTVDRNALFSLIRLGDTLGSYTVWQAGWLKGMQKHGGDENKAIAYADQSVRLTQPQSSIKDLPEIMRSGKEWKRLLTMFYSYYSVLYNQSAELLQRKKFGDASLSELISSFNYMYIIPPILKHLTQNRDADLEDMARGVGMHITGQVPFIRDVASSVLGGYPYTGSPAFDVVKQGVEVAGRGIRAATDSDYEIGIKDLDAAVRFAGEATGRIPSSQLMNIIRGMSPEGDKENRDALQIFFDSTIRDTRKKKKEQQKKAKERKGRY